MYVWHLEGNSADINDDLQTNIANLNTMLSAAGLPTNPAINIDEYGNVNEQVPAGAAWWISRLERYNARGLRGNWLGGAALHDFMASLLGKPNAGTGSYNPTAGGYWPNGEYQVSSSTDASYKQLTHPFQVYKVGVNQSYCVSSNKQLPVLCHEHDGCELNS